MIEKRVASCEVYRFEECSTPMEKSQYRCENDGQSGASTAWMKGSRRGKIAKDRLICSFHHCIRK